MVVRVDKPGPDYSVQLGRRYPQAPPEMGRVEVGCITRRGGPARERGAVAFGD